MNYTLPSGQVIDLARVSSVSKIRDFGRDSKSIDRHLIGFTVHLHKREVVEVTDFYYYSDWAEVKSRLKKLREDIIDKWEQEPQDHEP